MRAFFKQSSIIEPITNLDLNGEQCGFEFNHNLNPLLKCEIHGLRSSKVLLPLLTALQ